eukprot:scaffold331885_cov30-Prasinocladus_malaysianus.AAC.2
MSASCMSFTRYPTTPTSLRMTAWAPARSALKYDKASVASNGVFHKVSVNLSTAPAAASAGQLSDICGGAVSEGDEGLTGPVGDGLGLELLGGKLLQEDAQAVGVFGMRDLVRSFQTEYLDQLGDGASPISHGHLCGDDSLWTKSVQGLQSVLSSAGLTVTDTM